MKTRVPVAPTEARAVRPGAQETCSPLSITTSNGTIYVDFVHGALNHRRQFGGGKNQLIAKAVGIKSKDKPTILDVTAGLGRDAFILANLGCSVTMLERSSVIHALLQDGLLRAAKETWFQALSLSLIHDDAISYLSTITPENRPDVIYIDPMFPAKTKTALVKKEMRVLREVVGDDTDAQQLLSAALRVAKKRVVVKRARLAPLITAQKPDVVFEGKSSRFDVYLKTGISASEPRA